MLLGPTRVLGLVAHGMGAAICPVSTGYYLPDNCWRITLTGA